MSRPISKKWIARVEKLIESIDEAVCDAKTVDQAGYLQNRLEQAAVFADERVCELDS